MLEYILLFFALLGGFGFIFVFNLTSKAHYLIVRKPADKSNFVEVNRMIEKKDKKTGVIWWVSLPWAKKSKLPQPPPEVLDVGKRGRQFCEVYRLSEDEYIYIKDEGYNSKDKRKYVDSLKPFSAVQRQVVVQQFAKAEKSRQHSFLKENAMNLAALVFMMVIIVLGIVYSGEIFSGINNTQNGASGMIKEANILIQSLRGEQHVSGASSGSAVIVESSEAIPRE